MYQGDAKGVQAYVSTRGGGAGRVAPLKIDQCQPSWVLSGQQRERTREARGPWLDPNPAAGPRQGAALVSTGRAAAVEVAVVVVVGYVDDYYGFG